MASVKIKLLALLVLSAFIFSPRAWAGNRETLSDSTFNADYILGTMRRVADWQLNSWETKGFNHPKADWTNAVCYTGIFDLGLLPGNDKYLNTLVNIGNSLNWNNGRMRFYADDYCMGQTYALLYTRFKDKKMIAPFILQADSIVAMPHNEPLNWKNHIQLREWAWCDALFMGPPALSYLSTASGNPQYLNTAIKLWWKTTNFLYSPQEKLYFRDETYLDKTEKNGKKVFWSRGNGWVLGGLVRVMENIPAGNPEKKKFEKLYKDMVARIATLQQPDGSWHASLLDPDSYPVKEMSGTGFYCYAIAWGINHNLLNDKTYLPVVKKAWRALTSAVHPDGMLGYVQPIGASPDKVDQNSTEVYGVGSFLLSGTQLYQYFKKHPNAAH